MNEKTQHILKIVVLTVSLGIVLTYGLFVAWYCTPMVREVTCDSISIVIRDSKDLHFIEETDVRKFLDQQHVKTIGIAMNIESMDRIERCVEEMNMVKRAECYFDSQGCLYVEIWQRSPVYRVITPIHSYYIDTERQRMPFSKSFTAYLPIVSGQVDENFATNELFDFIVYLQNNSFWKDHIGQIHIKPNGELILGTKAGVSEIEFGNLENFETKLKHLKLWYEQYPDVAFSNKYQSVSVKYDHLIYGRKFEQ
ncbi:MAG: hypothetical protein J5808_07550 [Paludibacteraceae bacterium]|nr:hypothetical protein [Paludibacteraceae bacterium]